MSEYAKVGRDELAEDAARELGQGRVRRFLMTP